MPGEPSLALLKRRLPHHSHHCLDLQGDDTVHDRYDWCLAMELYRCCIGSAGKEHGL